MRVIFLDFDGVLNSEKYVRRCDFYGIAIDPTRMALLKRLVDATDATIVLSTSWREHWDADKTKCNETGLLINRLFEEYDIKILDKTPQLRQRRENEIIAWLDAHPSIKNFVIFDDAFLSDKRIDGHFIKTSNYRDGLDEQNILEAIRMLSK